MIETTAFYQAKDAIDQALRDARREYRELGTSLRIANEEREHLGDMLQAAIDLLAPHYGGDDAAAEAAVYAFATKRKEIERELVEFAKAVSS